MNSLKDVERQMKENEQGITKSDAALGLAGIAGGGAVANKHLDKATGLERKYHGTAAQNVDGILSKGILSSRAGAGAGSQRAMEAGALKQEDLDGTVYLGNKKNISANFAKQEGIRNLGFESGNPIEWLGQRFSEGELNKIPSDLKEIKRGGKILNVNIPYEELKNMDLIDNPELKGMNREEFSQYFAEASGQPDNPAFIQMGGKAHDALGNDTTTVRGDIDPRFIKGSEHYQRYGLRDMANYIKNNPGHFGKGALGVGAGVGAAGLGANHLRNKLQTEQVAAEIDNYMEKQASVKGFVKNVTGSNVKRAKKQHMQFMQNNEMPMLEAEEKMLNASKNLSGVRLDVKDYMANNAERKGIFKQRKVTKLPKELENELFRADVVNRMATEEFKDMSSHVTDVSQIHHRNINNAIADRSKARKQLGTAGVVGGASIGGSALMANKLTNQEEQLATTIYNYFEKVAFIKRDGMAVSKEDDPTAYQLKDQMDTSLQNFQNTSNQHVQDLQGAMNKPGLLTGGVAGAAGALVGSRFGVGKADKAMNATTSGLFSFIPGALGGAMYGAHKYNKDNPEQVKGLNDAYENYQQNVNSLSNYLKENNYNLS